MSFAQGKYKPSISSIDEIDDRTYKVDDIRKQQIEGSETAPLTINQHKLNIDTGYDGRKNELEVQNSKLPEDRTTPETPNSASPESVNGLRAFLIPGRLSFDALMRLSRKRRIMYITTACLCAALFLVIILMIAFWPEVPFYLKAELCLEKECVESSRQLLLWANTSKCPCHHTYEWACGNFAHEYTQNDYYVIKHGEWNFKTFNEYEELNELNRIISMLSSSGTSYTIESMITNLYRSCRDIDNLDKTASELLLKKAFNTIDSWQGFREPQRLQVWDYKKSLVLLQTIYGVFPYYKVTVDNRLNKPHDYIITLEEGDIGLPDKYFYNIDHNDEIIRGYKLLLRDFAINMGIVSHEADLFADETFHYEKRIVNNLRSVKSGFDRKVNEVQTLAELKTLAPSLPIFETLQAMFRHIKITEETEVLVKDVKALHEMSIIMSTSDKKPIYNFIIWSLARNLMPYLSTEYRNLIDNFDHTIYGRISSYPRWMVCSKIVKDWLPFAVEALQQNRINSKTTQMQKHFYEKPQRQMNKTIGNDQLLTLMFYTLRNQLQISVQQADWINSDIKEFINEKLTSIRLQIGIPEEALYNRSYIADYYRDLLLGNIFFAEHIESIWSFRKARLEEKLKTSSIVDTIISEMYTQPDTQPIIYSNILNMMIIKRTVAINNYYDYRYPIALNFARVGTDILEVLIDALSTFVEQYKADQISSRSHVDFAKVDVDCITSEEDNKEDLKELSANALKSFHITLSAAKITAKALSSFITAIDNNSPITGASMNPSATYQNLKLTQRLRMPGLHSYNENKLFTLAYMQKHCSTNIANEDYARIKPHVEHQLAERYLFNATWNHIQFLPRSSSCSVPDVRCSNIL